MCHLINVLCVCEYVVCVDKLRFQNLPWCVCYYVQFDEVKGIKVSTSFLSVDFCLTQVNNNLTVIYPDPVLGKTSWGHRQNPGGSNPLTWRQLTELKPSSSSPHMQYLIYFHFCSSIPNDINCQPPHSLQWDKLHSEWYCTSRSQC